MNTDISIRETRAAPRRTSILESVRASEIGAFFDPTQTSAENGTASVLSSTINLCNTLMGTGMLAMPTVIAVSGWIPGLVLLFLMCFCNIFTVEVVFRLCRIAGPPTSLSEIGDKAAARGSIVIDLAVALNCIGVASSYVIISTGNFYYTFGGPRSVWVLVTIAIATPLAFIKDMDSLRHTSFAAVAILLYIVVLVAVYAIIGTCDGDKSNGEYCPPGETAVATDFVGALRSFGEMGTLGVRIPPIYNEMDTPTPERCTKVNGMGFGLVTSLYVTVAVCGYYTFGDITPSNIIDAYPNNAPVAVARVGLSLVVIFS